jgi:hypothetical protein
MIKIIFARRRFGAMSIKPVGGAKIVGAASHRI